MEGTLRCAGCDTFYVITSGVVDMMHPHKGNMILFNVIDYHSQNEQQTEQKI